LSFPISGLAAFAILLWAGLAAASPRLIADDAALVAALAEGAGGQELVLAPGRYSPFRVSKDKVPAVIRSADPQNPAILEGVQIQWFENLRVQNVHFAYPFNPADHLNVRPFVFHHCSGLELVDNQIRGELAHGTGTEADGHGYGIGMTVRFCDDVLVARNHFSQHHRGLLVGESSNVTVRENEITALRMDGMTFAQVTDMVIEQNYFHSFDRVPDSPDHADFIQFWTASTTAPSTGIVIRNNRFTSGDGAWTQSIFMRNDLVDKGIAGDEMFYRDILVEENIIINAHLHGITVGEVHGLVVRNNTLVQNPASAGGDPTARVWVPTIRVADRSTGVSLRDNIMGDTRGLRWRPEWDVAGNLRVQNRVPVHPNYYADIFAGWPEGDPAAFETYRLRPEIPPVGASALHP
jgi:hypothetical protein